MLTARYRPAPRTPALGPAFADVVEPARFPKLALRYRNQRWAARVGLDALTDDEWRAAFGRFEPLPDNLPAPLALRYHGHQFRQYNPALGDGRGFLYAQLLDDDGRLLDLATKGSGTTPYSRGGDGRLTLKGGVREILATERLEALGVYTSKTFSVFETGESLTRHDEPSPTRACVLTRLGHSHVRLGSFQRHAFLRDHESLATLVRFSLDSYAPELCHLDGPPAARALLQLVVERSARLAAQWMAAGFVHGVLNTDNLNVTGESFDYGPYRFLPTLQPGFTAAYFDHTGLYSYGNQPGAVKWALEQFALALEPIAGGPLTPAVAAFDPAYHAALDAAVLARLGVASRGPLRDRLLRTSTLALLEASQIGFDRLFFDWYGGAAATARAARSPIAATYRTAAARDFVDDVARHPPRDGARLDHPYFAGDQPCTLVIDEVEAIWTPIALHDDWSGLDRAIARARHMGQALSCADATP